MHINLLIHPLIYLLANEWFNDKVEWKDLWLDNDIIPCVGHKTRNENFNVFASINDDIIKICARINSGLRPS